LFHSYNTILARKRQIPRAAGCVQGAMFVLLILVAFGVMFGGKKGAMWVINTALSPVKAAFRMKIIALIYLCMFVIPSYCLGSRIAQAVGF